MEESALRLRRREAYGAVRSAVQAHERNPSDISACAVEHACARLRQVGEEQTWARRHIRYAAGSRPCGPR